MPPADTDTVLHWEVFVTPGIPIVTRDKPPDVRQTFFQAMAATLIYGVRDAVLVDTFMTVTQANALADWVAARGRNLKTIYITHGHGDHWFGVATLLERFPECQSRRDSECREGDAPECLARSARGELEGVIPRPDSGQTGDRRRTRRDTSSISRDMNWSQLNWVIPTPTTRPVYTSLLSDSWLRGMPPTMTSTSTLPNQTRRHGRSGSQRSTRLSRSTHAQWSRHTSDLKTTTILGSSNRLGSTSAISIALRRRRRPLKSSTRRCWSSIPIESTLGGRSGVRHVQSSR